MLAVTVKFPVRRLVRTPREVLNKVLDEFWPCEGRDSPAAAEIRNVVLISEIRNVVLIS